MNNKYECACMDCTNKVSDINQACHRCHSLYKQNRRTRIKNQKECNNRKNTYECPYCTNKVASLNQSCQKCYSLYKQNRRTRIKYKNKYNNKKNDRHAQDQSGSGGCQGCEICCSLWNSS